MKTGGAHGAMTLLRKTTAPCLICALILCWLTVIVMVNVTYQLSLGSSGIPRRQILHSYHYIYHISF